MRATAPRRASHAVALEHLLAGRAELRAVVLQADLNLVVIAEILPAETRGVARTGVLLLRRAGMLRQRERRTGNQEREGKGQPDHHKPHQYRGKFREGKLSGRVIVPRRIVARVERVSDSHVKQQLSVVIPGRASWREPGIHTHDGGYGFRARRFAAPRNDER